MSVPCLCDYSSQNFHHKCQAVYRPVNFYHIAFIPTILLQSIPTNFQLLCYYLVAVKQVNDLYSYSCKTFPILFSPLLLKYILSSGFPVTNFCADYFHLNINLSFACFMKITLCVYSYSHPATFLCSLSLLQISLQQDRLLNTSVINFSTVSSTVMFL